MKNVFGSFEASVSLTRQVAVTLRCSSTVPVDVCGIELYILSPCVHGHSRWLAVKESDERHARSKGLARHAWCTNRDIFFGESCGLIVRSSAVLKLFFSRQIAIRFALQRCCSSVVCAVVSRIASMMKSTSLLFCACAAISNAVAMAGPSLAGGTTAVPPAFGHDMLQYFSLDPHYTNLNHGSYGSTPKVVQEAAQQWESLMEENPDNWFRYQYFDEMDKLREAVADYIGAKKEDVVFVPNASHGMNAILRSLKLQADEKVLYLNTAYRMVQNTLEFLHDFRGEQLVQANVTWPGSNSQVWRRWWCMDWGNGALVVHCACLHACCDCIGRHVSAGTCRRARAARAPQR